MTGRLEGISGGKPLVMIWPLLVSVLGIAFCAWNALGNTLDFCISAGCNLNESITLGGISLWWYGTVAFCILVVVSLSGRPWLGIGIAGLCVIIDLFLLLLMLCTAPCISCLVVGLIFIFAYVAFRHVSKGLDPIPRSSLVAVWIVLCIANIGVLLQSMPGTWSIYGAKTPAINVYFSPSCPSCLMAVKALAKNSDAAFYPVVEKDEDFTVIASMISHIRAGKDIVTSLEMAKRNSNNNLGFFENTYLYFYLLRNKAKVFMSGSKVVPFIEYKGLPAALVPPKSQTAPVAPVPSRPSSNMPIQDNVEPMETIESMDPINMQNDKANMDANLPIDTGIAGSCGGETQTPCPDTDMPN